LTSVPTAGAHVHVAPIGVFAPDLMTTIVETIERVYGLECHAAPLIDEIAFAYDADRKQYHSTAILEALTAAASADTFKVLASTGKILAPTRKILALTREDLFIPILTHVYGEAQLGGTSCVVSTHRLAEGISRVNARECYLERVAKEAAHELGHTFDLRHCPDAYCIMHYCRSIEDVDHKGSDLCRYCRVMLGDYLKKQCAGKPVSR
jgi:archaemetzincin